MKLILAIHDKKIIENISFSYFNEKEGKVATSHTISIHKTKALFPVPAYEISDRFTKNMEEEKLKEIKKIKVKITILGTNKITLFYTIDYSLINQKKLILAGYFLNMYYRCLQTNYSLFYETLYRSFCRKTEYIIGTFEEDTDEIQYIERNSELNIQSFIEILEIQGYFEHYSLYLKEN